eukprot:scaffold91487_cov30-Tisochrysis_lutea.AAC.5
MRRLTVGLLLLPFAAVAWLQWACSLPGSRRAARVPAEAEDAAVALLAVRKAVLAERKEREASERATRLDAPQEQPASDPAEWHAFGQCTLCHGVVLDAGAHGQIRLHLRPEWCSASEAYVRAVAAHLSGTSNVYRLEPGFLIQGRLAANGVGTLRKTARARKVSSREYLPVPSLRCPN